MIARKSGPVTAVVVGVGSRGREAYGAYAERNQDRLKFVAVADVNEDKRKLFKNIHGISDDMAFETWEDLLSEKNGKLADAAFICTPDRLHYEPAMRALELGYDLVLEKPISPTIEECQAIAKLAEEKGRLVQVCHVLRFTGFWKKVKEIVDSGRIGKILHYDHSENVSYWHFGHSFVRGFYKNKDTSTPIVLAKTCHDLDLMYWILGEKAVKVQSTGELMFYKPENAPAGAPERCTDGCPAEQECPWYAPRLYMDAEPLIRIGKESKNPFLRSMVDVALNHKGVIKFFSLFYKRLKTINNWDRFPATALTTDLTPEGKMKALKEGPFGLCIYKTGNDVPDHQISTFNFPSGATGTLTMHGLSDFEGRELRIFGSKGTLRGFFRSLWATIEVHEFRSGKTEMVFKENANPEQGHGGGDAGLMDAFTGTMLGEIGKESLTDIQGALESHYMGFAAEESRLSRKVLDISGFREKK
ncbi:MAG: Gfo/Idh/MocA family protein [Candidatus Hodarchaeota archaeon]